ncbi:MAG: ChrB protein [Planctomycetes bacterium]|nr:ChrB protein [Planctomycetota bacterium]
MKESQTGVSGTWLLLTYQVPRHPSAARVYVWRKLRRLGAELLHDSVWLLPASDRTAEQFRWLVGEIKELRGDASVWICRPATADQEDRLIRAFCRDVDRQYGKILSALNRGKADLAVMSRRYQEVLARDYFGSPVGTKVRRALLKSKGGDAR